MNVRMKKRAGAGAGTVMGMGGLCSALLDQPQIRVSKSE